MKKILFLPITAVRFVAAMLIIILGALLMLIVSPFRGEISGSSPAAWAITLMSRLFLFVTNLRVEPFDRKRLAQHEGYIFPNHQSYLDAVILYAIRPMRFLAMAAVADIPFISTIAKRIGTVFINREDPESRAASKRALAQTVPAPPIVIFPEGKIATTFDLQPFRHGAFELAVESGYPYQPVVFLYEPSPVARWTYNSMMLDFWYTLWRGPVTVRVVLLPLVYPEPDANPAQLAQEMWEYANMLYEPTIPANPPLYAKGVPTADL